MREFCLIKERRLTFGADSIYILQNLVRRVPFVVSELDDLL